MKFEWDEGKRKKNLAKHGLDFRDVPGLDWEAAVVLEDMRRDYGERRYWAFISKAERLHVVTFATRGANIRIINFRKASRREIRDHGQA